MSSPSIVYLDHAATSWPKPAAVLEAWAHYHRDVAGSPGRGAHRGALEAARRVERVRADLTEFLGGSDPSRLVFQPSCTHALNLVFSGFLREGDHVIATDLDHNSVLRPLRELERRGVVALTIVPATADGFVPEEALARAVQPHTRLVVCTHASNVLGTIQDVAAFVRVARNAGARILLDAAQTAGVVPIDVRRMDLDFVALPSHKGLLGPAGSGALYVTSGIDLVPAVLGGTGLDSALDVPPVSWPASFEAGTGNPAGIAALGAGLRHVAETGVEAILAHGRAIVERIEEGLAELPTLTLYGTRDLLRRTGVLAFNVQGMEPSELSALLDASFGIRVRAGLCCAPRVVQAAGAPPSGVVRVSVGPESTFEEADRLVAAVAAIASSP